jgi:bifunctional ADP-heptose synthase (sugar kinase/adenylyltransferase)
MTDYLTFQQQTSLKVLLIGETCSDEFVYGECTRLNPESPVPVLNFKRKEVKAGMSANVFENLKAFGVNVIHLTNREKITKTRYVDERYNHHLLRVDEDIIVEHFRDFLPPQNFSAVVVSDYGKGFITIDKLIEIVETYSCPIFVDTKKVTLPDAPHCFIKINEPESKRLRGKPENLIITLGERGALYQNKIYRGDKVKVFDVVGAGDTFLAALTYYYLMTNNIHHAILFANKAAAIAVQHPGTYVLTKDDVDLLCRYRWDDL